MMPNYAAMAIADLSHLVGQATIVATQAAVIEAAARETGVSWGQSREFFEMVWSRHLQDEPDLSAIQMMIDETVELIRHAH